MTPITACTACQTAAADPLSGLYRMDCLACCVRLVLSAHPSRQRAAGMMASIERRSPFSRAVVLAQVQERLRERAARAHAAAPGPASDAGSRPGRAAKRRTGGPTVAGHGLRPGQRSS